MRIFAAPGLIVFVAAFVGPLPSPTPAQNMDAMSKWASAKVIHYHVAGDFKGTTEVLRAAGGRAGGERGTVSDHVEFDFDWDQLQQKMVADPVFRNFPSKIESLEKTPSCPDSKLNGPFEYFTFESVRAVAVMFELRGKRNLPPGVLSYQSEQGCGTVPAPAATEQVTARMQLALGMILAMPMASGEMEVTKDGKSILQKINTDGWVWTMTPTIVK